MKFVKVQYIEDQREKVGLDSDKFSAYCNISRSTYHQMMENKSASLKTLDKIAKFLIIDISELLEKTDHSNTAINKTLFGG